MSAVNTIRYLTDAEIREQLYKDGTARTIHVDESEVEAYECKHATYTPSKFTKGSDLLTIKELIHYKDGSKVPCLRFIKDFERPFWLVKKPYQNYKDKKEWEYLDKLQLFRTTQANLNESIVRAQGWGNPNTQLRMLARNQYLYGCDITTPTLIKAGYQRKYNNIFTPNKVAVLDTETDVVNGDGREPILVSLTFKDKAFVGILKRWVDGIANVEEKVMQALEKHLGKDIEARGIKFEICIRETSAELVYECIQRAHKWQPDFITFWNMDFDMGVMLDVLTKAGYDPAEVFSDPSVPPEFRYFNYRQGAKTKVKADGTVENLASYDRWNVGTFPASFQIICSMCVYRKIRVAKGKEPSYSLGYQLDQHVKRQKLYFETGDAIADQGGIEWHIQMQMNFKIPYIVYNVFDCLGVELLDEKTRDLQTQVSILSGFSEYSVFHSNPRRAADKLHFFCLSMGKVAGCVSDQMIDENDGHLLGKEEWINE